MKINYNEIKLDENVLDFNKHILSLAESGKIDAMDVIIEYCEANDIDYDEIGDMVLSKLKSKIRQEAISRNLMKKKKSLY